MVSPNPYKKGDRVRLTEAYRAAQTNTMSRRSLERIKEGTVFSDPRSLRMVMVLWDGYATAQTYSVSFVEHVPSGEK